MVCFECGKEKDHDHHVVPQSLGGTKTIPLCFQCHDKVHGSKTVRTSMLSELVKAGIKKRKAKGLRFGPIPKYDHSKIIAMYTKGLKPKAIAEIMHMSRESVRGVLKVYKKRNKLK